MSGRRFSITLELTADQAAGLLRFADKSGHDDALRVLYAHRPREQRSEQASQICAALIELQKALENAGVRSWPWVETGGIAREPLEPDHDPARPWRSSAD